MTEYPSDQANSQLAAIEARVSALEARLPSSRLLNGGFLSRAFAVWGHWVVAHTILALGVTIVVGFFVVLFLGLALVFD